MKDNDINPEAFDLTDSFIEALKNGFKNEALSLLSDPSFDVDDQAGLPLSVAIELGYLDIASNLIAVGADPNLGIHERKSAIVLALENEYLELADMLLQHGAQISARDARGWTPLIWASIKGRQKAVQYLVENGADLHICSNDGWNAITGAFFKQHSKIVEFLLAQGACFGAKYQEAVLLSAYEHGAYEVVKSLIERGVNVNVGTANGQPLLVLVLGRGDLDILNLLLDAGADVNIRDTNGNPALLSAIQKAQYPSATRLVEHGASVNAMGPNWAPIHIAAQSGQVQLCESLLKAGASVDQLGAKASTALMLAAENRHLNTVKLLLENGANPHLKNTSAKSPKSLADPSLTTSETGKIIEQYEKAS